jgi:hypothetical protein
VEVQRARARAHLRGRRPVDPDGEIPAGPGITQEGISGQISTSLRAVCSFRIIWNAPSRRVQIAGRRFANMVGSSDRVSRRRRVRRRDFALAGRSRLRSASAAANSHSGKFQNTLGLACSHRAEPRLGTLHGYSVIAKVRSDLRGIPSAAPHRARSSPLPGTPNYLTDDSLEIRAGEPEFPSCTSLLASKSKSRSTTTSPCWITRHRVQPTVHRTSTRER